MNIGHLSIKSRLYLIICGVIALFVSMILMSINMVDGARDMGIQKAGQVMLKDQEEKIKVATHSLALAIGHALEGVQDEAQQVQAIGKLTADVRFEADHSSYFFAYKNTTALVHPSAKLVGMDMHDVKDANGVYLVQELHQAAKNGGGFVHYIWDKPGAGKAPKLSYAEMIPHTAIWLGTGVYLDNIGQYQSAMAEELRGYTRQKMTRMLVLGGVCLAVVFCMCLMIAASISKRLKQMIAFSERLAGGDFSRQMRIAAKDEIGMAGGALNRMVDTLGGVFREVNNGVGTLNSSSKSLAEIASQLTEVSDQTSAKSRVVAGGAGQLSTNMDGIATASEEASTNVNIAASSVEEMSHTVKDIAKSSDNARNIAEDAVARAQSASRKVDQLGLAASAISNVIEVINEISDQTNLLALNATIEAARAGEAGKGFAVVANEIKELARQTATATGEIKVKVDGIQTASTQTMEDIKAISNVIDEINSIISVISAAVDEQSTAAGDISENVGQVSQGIGAVNANIADGAVVTQQITKEIDEVSASAGNLSISSSQVSVSANDLQKLADRLAHAIKRFHIRAAAFDIGRVKNAHLQWRTRLEAVIHGRQAMAPEEVTSHHECDFGKWYESPASQALVHQPAFRSVGRFHESVHQLARQIVDAVNQKDTSQAKQLSTEFETQREKMFDALDELYRS
ncbi:MAG: methyl-accepting chemotaxis protein [Desulfosarcinaceae bacterium]